jgi:hypothetical protein
MRKDEADKLQLALDGVMANLETLRVVIGQLVTEIPLERRTEPIITEQSVDSNVCSHENIRQIETMGGTKSYCFDCDHAE